MLLPQATTRKAPLIEVATIVLPLVAYLVLKQIAGNDTVALAVAEAIPCVWIVAMMACTKKFQPIALVPLIVFGIVLLITLLSGGSTLPLKLRRGFLTGGIGIACLVSLAIRRPLLEVLLPFFLRLRRIPERQARVLTDTDVGHRLLVGITALRDRPWECVVIGGGIRTAEDQPELFEQVVNLVRRHAPGAAIDRHVAWRLKRLTRATAAVGLVAMSVASRHSLVSRASFSGGRHRESAARYHPDRCGRLAQRARYSKHEL